MIDNLDIIDRLDNEDGFVKLVLRSGRVVYGRPLLVDWSEDDEGWDTIKGILFKPYNSKSEEVINEDEIDYYEAIEEADIPKA